MVLTAPAAWRKALAMSDSFTPEFNIMAAAREAAAAIAGGRRIETFSSRAPAPGLDDAYRVAAAMRAMAGSPLTGRKIGFTNRRIWPQYGVSAPIWGDVTEATLFELSELEDGLPLAGLCEPRLEPELIFGLGAAPAPDMDLDALADCVDWAAPGFEIVQSIYPDWRFEAPDTVIANGLHGRLLMGEPTPSSRLDFTRLAALSVRLTRDGAEADTGSGADVLDSPLYALAHLVALLADDPHNPPLSAGELVSTGTLTKAWPVTAGETWRAEYDGQPLAAIEIRLA